jgi:2-methylcitrate dehydratase
MRDVLTAIIKAYEIHGVLAEGNRPNTPGIGLDLVILLKIASTAVLTQLMGGTHGEIVAALSNAFIDGHSLDLYRHMPHSGQRKSWASADATSRAVRLAQLALAGEMGYATALSAPEWGFDHVLYHGAAMALDGPLGSRVIENVQYKIAYPAQRHSQTAAECAVRLHPHVAGRLDAIEQVALETHKLAYDKINVTGPLPNFAARDHCLQYVVAVGLIYGDITTASYQDACAADPRIDALRARMIVREESRYTADYEDAAKRSNANAVQVHFRDGTCTPRVEVEHLIGDARRRAEGLPRLEAKFRAAIATRLPPKRQRALGELFGDGARFEAMPVHEFVDLWAA